MRILIDTNVILDILQKREPFFADSYQALRKAIEADAECLISASAATDIFYMLRKAFQSAQKAKERIEQLPDRHLCRRTGRRYSYRSHALHAGF